MDSKSSVSMLSTIFMLCLVHVNAAPSKLVQDFCSKTDNLHDCVAALSPDPQSSTVTSYHDLAQIALRLAVKNTTVSKEFIKSLKNKDPVINNVLNQCVTAYDASINSFSSALKEVDEDPETAGYDAAVASDGPDQCVTAFNSAKRTFPPEITSLNGFVKLYSKLANSITDHL